MGSTIKKWATFISIVGSLLSLFLGIPLMSLMFHGPNSGMPVIGIIFIAIGIAMSIMTGHILYGFGELIENSSESAEILRDIRNGQDELCELVAKLNAPTGNPPEAMPSNDVMPGAGQTAANVTGYAVPQGAAGEQSVNDDFVVCPSCQKINRKSAGRCISCGQQLFSTEQ